MMTLSNMSYVADSKDWTAAQKGTAVFILLVIDVSATACNILIIATVMFAKNARPLPEAPLVANLAFSDLLVALVLIPSSIDVILSDQLRFGSQMASFIGFCNFLFCIASIINLTALAVDQLLLIKWPFKFETSRLASSKFAFLWVWLHSAACGLPPYFGISSYNCFIPNIGHCTKEEWSGRDDSVVFTVLVVTSSWGISVVILVFVYTNIYLVVRRQRRAIAKTMVHLRDCSLLKVANRNSSGACVENIANLDDDGTNHLKAQGSLFANFWSKNQANMNIQRQISNVGQPFWIGRQRRSRDVVMSSYRYLNKRLFGVKQNMKCSCIPNSKPANSLLIIVIVYLISWTPFCIDLLLEIAQKKREHRELALIFLWIGYSSSLLNPLLYLYRFTKLRKAAIGLARDILHCKTGTVSPDGRIVENIS